MLFLMNSAVITSEGVYRYRELTPKDAKEVFDAAVAEGEEVISSVGYPTTASHMSKVLDYSVEVTRLPVLMKKGDVAIVCKLTYRVPDPSEKGKFQPKETDYEWGLLEKLED